MRHPGRQKDSILQKTWSGFKLYCMSGLKAQFKSSSWAKAGHAFPEMAWQLHYGSWPWAQAVKACAGEGMSLGPSQCPLIKPRKDYPQLLKSYEGSGRDCNILYLRKECVVPACPLGMGSADGSQAVWWPSASGRPHLVFCCSFCMPQNATLAESPWFFIHMETTTNRNNGRCF